ncbi:hypothetical protein FRC12_013327 [Ceratobasidium sp. 428]|nr:hypothetical protein FRC12_013327 [Ceratobasidium sp. 428]
MAIPLSEADSLLNVVYHVFLPPQLPQQAPPEDHERQINHRLALLTLEAVDKYQELVTGDSNLWKSMSRMLSQLAQHVKNSVAETQLQHDMSHMQPGDVLALHIHEQNAGVLVRKATTTTTFEIFEAQAPNASVMSVPGKLVRHFPGPAIQVPNFVYDDSGFIQEISHFLSRMNADILDDAIAKTIKAGSKVAEPRDSADPHYISQLFTGILRGFGDEIEPRRVLKRIADEVLWDNTYLPWRRSPIWLVIRVALQTSLNVDDYKNFMVYFHAHLLDLGCSEECFPDGLLSTMRSKMARRLLKIQCSVPDYVLETADSVTRRAETLLQNRWAAIQTGIPQFQPLDLELDPALTQSLPNSRDYLAKVLEGRSSRGGVPSFKLDHCPEPTDQPDFSEFTNGALSTAFKSGKYLALFDFENSVHDHLSTWVDNNLTCQTSCSTIFSCFEQYVSLALEHYVHDVADRSIMILTVMELWVALDRLATAQYNILLDYSPEIPVDIIESLLLRTSLHLERARIVQGHLSIRHTQSQAAGRGSVFTERVSNDSLSVRFFQQSSRHQDLKRTIEQAAKVQRQDKIEELHQLNAKHAQLTESIASSSCETYEDRWGFTHHDEWRCDRCSKKRQASDMRIQPHEWPLPSNPVDAEAVVFELDCPEALNIWRSATYKILIDLGSPDHEEQAEFHRTLNAYNGLSQWSLSLDSSNHRITIASSTKSFLRSHYSTTKIPTTESAVGLNNGLTFQLFDTDKCTWAAGPFTQASFVKYGTFTLPANSSYRYLQFSLETTTHTSNQILADQSDCPEDLSLHEHYAFGTLRSGPRLQWMNMVRGLEENVLTYSREEVNLLHTQAAWQIGPLSANRQFRDWHLELCRPEYGRLLVDQAMRVLNRVQANWLEATSVQTIVMLVARLLSATVDMHTQTDAYAFLRKARAVTLKWLKELSIKLQNAKLESQILDYQLRVCEMAAICRSTYDVDSQHLRQLLSSSDEYLALILCTVTLYDNQLPKLADAPQDLQALLARDRRLAYKAFPIVLEKLQDLPRLLDDSVCIYWDGYRPGLFGWVALPAPNSGWVFTITEGNSREASQQVHFNTLNGSLLVDGRPLGRLPRNYVTHPTYTRLFGQKVLDIVPASSPGMIFSARTHIDGNKVSFCIEEKSGELVVQSQLEDGDIFQLIPHSIFVDDLPLFFAFDYHHWIDLKTGVVEFRPLTSPWSSHNKNWHLRFSSSSTSIMEQTNGNGSTILLDIHSPAFKAIARHIGPLESSRYVHATQSTRDFAQDITQINVGLPRMKLAFFVNEDMQLESSNLRGHVIDESQSTGTMFGLRNQLVLRTKDLIRQSLPQSRAVLIPYGKIECSLSGHHSRVTINNGSERHVGFYQYKIDTDLGYLANGDTNLTSRLFKIYLHALTSHCLPDPLTGRTGTEEALYELSESATSSFEQINEEQARLLSLIGALTPQRVYYPAHLQSMQTVNWMNLPPLAQHYAFCTAANAILDRARSLQLFSPLSFNLENHVTEFNTTLLKRAAYRTRMYYPMDTVARLSTVLEDSSNCDHSYEGRDHYSSGWTNKSQLASWASGLVHKRWGRPTYLNFQLKSQLEGWNIVDGPASKLSLTYSSDWLHLSMRSSWISLYNLTRNAPAAYNQYSLGVCLAAAIYSETLPRDLLPPLVAFATNPAFQQIQPPSHPSYQLLDKYIPTQDQIWELISSAEREMASTPADDIPRREGEPAYNWQQRRRNNYNTNISTLKAQLTQTWLNCWPNLPSDPPGSYAPWFNTASCFQKVETYFRSCLRNRDLQSHLEEVESMLSSSLKTTSGLELEFTPSALPVPSPQPSLSFSFFDTLCLNRIMKRPDYPDLKATPQKSALLFSTSERLQGLLAEFDAIPDRPLHRRYGSELEASRMGLAQTKTPAIPNQLPPLKSLEENRASYKDHLCRNLQKIKGSLGPKTNVESIASCAGMWPRLTPRTILGRLALCARTSNPSVWNDELAEYARAYIEHQRSQRLISLSLEDQREEFYKELNLEHAPNSEAPANDPDWLLVQIDGNFSPRTIQTQVAQEMIEPSSSASTVLQLNMGEGKSSVIVPIISAALADSTRLVRVVVLKPLWRQMFHLLVSRLAGLVNRRVYYLPVGRHIRVGSKEANQIQTLYTECMREGGILLVQPEHVLSFKLMGIDQLISSSSSEDVAVANQLRDMQTWLSNNARDILDESDEILHVRYQLVYTVGEQQPLEGHPDRWTTTQQTLSLVARHLSQLKVNYSDQVTYEARRNGRFPFIRLMPESEEVVGELVRSVAEDVISGRMPNLNLGLLSPESREAARRFMIEKSSSESDILLLKEVDVSMRNSLLVLRGLLACGIVAFALRDKHYRVDYGLHLARSLLAVPYRAKDIPSSRAEFGHPDVSVVLTCLSYYYSGLTEQQLCTCFELLYKLDNPVLEYEQWVHCNERIPSNLQQLSGVNLKDKDQFVKELIPVFARNSAVVDFFLSSVVFPKEAKQFPYKLSTSGWDLAEVKTHVTTGFSGTNDNQYLLPTSIAQSDPVKQSSTNALVLTYLLQPENDHYVCIPAANGDRSSAMELIKLLVKQDPEIRVLLDVGAQMLELKNDELVKHWLELRPDVAAAVYFDDKDELVILPQNGSPTPFFSSPLAQQMDKCVVYLDDGHTRGTDLKLPRETRAAVTLGPKVTKDRLLQGCMRMRKLGHGQSVMFCAPTEIDSQIRKAAHLTSDGRIETLDVLRWAMLETCKDLEHHISHWAQQGVEYNRRAHAQREFERTKSIEMLKNGWTTPESRSLQEMYDVLSSTGVSSESFTQTAFGIDSLKQRLESLGVRRLEDPSMDEEQEREVSHEVEQERQIERPPKSKPAKHVVREEVRRFVKTGCIPHNPVDIVSLFRPLHSSGRGQSGVWSKKLVASLDFCKTLATSTSTQLSEYMRPVNWILSGKDGILVALSPYEVHELLPDIRQSAFVRLHVFAPRVTQSMISFSDLRFYSTPSSARLNSPPPELLLQLQLSLFAGQLYFEDHSHYRALCAFLGIYMGGDATHQDNDIQVQTDGFVAPANRQRLPEYADCAFASSPVTGLKDLVGYRRKGMGFLRTHMGQVLHARQLTPNDF